MLRNLLPPSPKHERPVSPPPPPPKYLISLKNDEPDSSPKDEASWTVWLLLYYMMGS